MLNTHVETRDILLTRQQKTKKLNDQPAPVLSDQIKQDLFLAFQTGGCLLLHESSAEFLQLLSFSNKQSPANSNFQVT